jgi:elongation factor G
MALQTKIFPLKINIRAVSESDFERLMSSLEGLVRNGALFSWSIGTDETEISLAGIHELHLDQIIGEMIAKGIHLQVGAPEVAYLETTTRHVTKDYTFKNLSGGSRQFARVILEITPLERNMGFRFENKATEESVPAQFVAGVQKGIASVVQAGVLFGFPVVDIKVSLIDGAYHYEDSSQLTFEIAAGAAIKEGLIGAGTCLLEPIMEVEISTSEQYVSAIIKSLIGRRGVVTNTSATKTTLGVVALVPLANLFGYSVDLSKLTKGEARHEMVYSHYDLVSAHPDDDPDYFPPAIGMRA